MHIKQLQVRNYKAIVDVDVVFHPKMNVIVGVNGAGKSSILHSVENMIGRYVSGLRFGRYGGPYIAPNSVRRGQSEIFFAVCVSNGESEFRWSVNREYRNIGSVRIQNDLIGVKELTQDIAEKVNNSADYSVPLFVHYPVNRAVLDVPLRVKGKVESGQLAAFNVGQQESARNFRKFFAWFREREDLENELRVRNPAHRDHHLEAVRTAIQNLMPGFSDLRVRRAPLRMLINKGTLEIRVDDLSDGEKDLLALAGDLARRMSLANPGLSNPLTGTGVVLIDEIELHLHPGWQRMAVTNLPKSFPNIQFVATTHSPQVVSELTPDQVIILDGGRARRPTMSYGREASDVLEDIMGDSARPASVEKKIAALYTALERGELELAESKLATLERIVGDDSQLTTARVAIRRRKILAENAPNK